MRTACLHLKREKRLQMAYLGTVGEMALFICNNIFASNLYYYQKRQDVFAELNLISIIINYVLIVIIGYFMNKSNDRNNYDLKAQLMQLVFNVIASITLICGYYF